VKVLALGAHPDDIEIFMFGTLAAYAAQGAELTFAVATDGAKGGKGDATVLVRIRREEAAIRRAFPCPRLRVADRGLREGMLVELMRADGAWQETA